MYASGGILLRVLRSTVLLGPWRVSKQNDKSTTVLYVHTVHVTCYTCNNNNSKTTFPSIERDNSRFIT